MIRFFIAIVACLLLVPAVGFSQKSSKKKKKGKIEATAAYDLQLDSSPVFKKGFTGFALFDPAEDKMLYEYNSDRYFTPASNTKIFTLYTAISMLPDSIPGLLYSEQGDLLIFWGTGDPSFLNPHLQQNPLIFNFLKNHPKQLVFCPANFQDKHYGSGWMWDDFPYEYQAEKSPLPVYGNVAHFRQDSTTHGIAVLPSFLKNSLKLDPALDLEDLVGRLQHDNQFIFNPVAARGKFFEGHVPFRYSPAFLADVLADTLKRSVHLLTANLMPPADARVLKSLATDSLYRQMMQESDNFIAEQLLLLCSRQQFGTMNTEQAIDFAETRLLADLPDSPQWVDGSGLSRYNLFTPRSVAKLLHKLYQVIPQERLFGIFPTGGVNGTIKTNYRNGGEPFVFAKTGTLRNNHCLSGYLLTKKEKVLIFSFMHNNFKNGTTALKKEMERVLKQVREDF
ncbi:MAG: D-alanyl-D-alanine carboxypeptidase [Bacteroidota bacterium]